MFLKNLLRKIISWFRKTFSKGVHVPITPTHVIEIGGQSHIIGDKKYGEIIKYTAGGRHAWINSKYGVIRKPLNSL